MKKALIVFFLSFSFCLSAQEISLYKGVVTDNLTIHDSISENFAIYLPKNFSKTREWPVVFLFDMQGRGKQVVGMFKQAAEEQGYILAASNNNYDTLSLSKNILIASRLLDKVFDLLPIKRGRVYTAGFGSGARMASLIPSFIKGVSGVISCGSPIANVEVLSTKNKFHFIGIVGNEDYNFRPMLSTQKELKKLKFFNQLLIFEGGSVWPESKYLSKALAFFTIAAMSKGIELEDEHFVNVSFNKNMGEVSALLAQRKPLFTEKLLVEMIDVFRTFKDVDSLKANLKNIRKSPLFKEQNRSRNAAFLIENFIKDEYIYLVEEDVATYNYDNLGWWKYKIEELAKLEAGNNVFEKHMAKRLKGFLNALIDDHVYELLNHVPLDEEALTFLYMLKTITDPQNPDPYMQVISNSAKVEDYGTALFYLEELLKIGYTNKEELYAIPNTAIFRLTPEFNELVARYLKVERYKVPIEEN